MPRVDRLTRVVIVEDHLVVAEAMEIALGIEGYDVHRAVLPGSAAAVGGLITSVLALEPQVVLLDLDLGVNGPGIRLVEPLSRAGVAVVVVTSNPDPARWGECLVKGARTVVEKAASLNGVVAAIRLIGEGRAVMDRDTRTQLVLRYREEDRELQDIRRRLAELTPREQQVLDLLVAGRAVREIARDAVVTESTVRSQVKAILAKLDVSSQLAAVGAANRVGWTSPYPRGSALHPRSSG